MEKTFFSQTYESSEVENVQEKTSIIGLFGKSNLEDIQRKIAKATGLAFVTVDYKGEPVTETTLFTEYCQNVRNGEKSCCYCKRSDAFGALQAVISRKPSVYFCPCGLLEVAIPIEDQGVFLGGFIGGQVRCQDAPSDVPRLEKVFRQEDDLVNSEHMLQLKEQMKEMPYAQFMDIVNLIYMIINQLCENESSHAKDTHKIQKKLEDAREENKGLNFRMEVLAQKLTHLKMNQNIYFITNTLSAISSMAVLENATETNGLVLELAEYMRNSVKSPELFWTVEEELEQVEHYIHLSCAKYGERFSYQIRILEKLRNKKIPVYALLPFVENAIYYGIALQTENSRLEINSNIKDNIGEIIIEENGPGLQDEELQERFQMYQGKFEGKYIDKALFQARDRLVTVFGKEYLPEQIVEAKKGRKFIIRIPLIFAEGGMDVE